MKPLVCVILMIIIAGCAYRPATSVVWADAISDEKFKIEKTYDNLDVIERFRKADRIVLDRDDYVIVKYGPTDYAKTYGKAVALTPITLAIDGVVIILSMGAVR